VPPDPSHMALSDSHFDAGYEAMRNMDYETAESEFKVALTYKHDHTKTLLHYGLLLQSRKDFTGAVDMWKVGADAMLKNRHHVKMLCNLSIVLTKVLGDHDAAEKYFKAALECDKDHVGVLVSYSRVPKSQQIFCANPLSQSTTTHKCAIHFWRTTAPILELHQNGRETSPWHVEVLPGATASEFQHCGLCLTKL
jgi:Tfp pilus assembly protein PilF